MKAFINVYENEVIVMVRAESSEPDDNLVGDAMINIGPGEDFDGIPYEDLVSHGDGEIKINAPDGASIQ